MTNVIDYKQTIINRIAPDYESRDWGSIEMEYRTGLGDLNSISSQYSVPADLIARVATALQWMWGNPVPSVDSAPENFVLSSADIRKAQAIAAIRVTETHRAHIRRVQVLAERLTGELESTFDTGEPSSLFGSRESPADVLVKLTASMVRLIALERQVHGLSNDSKQVEPAAEDNSAQVQSLWDRLDKAIALKSIT